MQIAKSSMWFKVYRFGVRRVYPSSDGRGIMHRRTDLCHFMRVIFLYLPFIYIFSVSVSVAFVMLVWFNPWSSVAVLAVLVSFGTFLAGILGTVYLCAEAESTEPIREWVKAKKHKYCPMVTFYEEENEKDQAETSQYQ